MQSQDKYRIAVLAAYAIALHGVERFIPMPIPWLRFGFANIIALTTLILFGFKAAMFVTIIRIVIGSMIIGTFLGPAFIMSLTAGISATLFMGLFYTLFGRLFSPIGISLIGALFHNLAQLGTAYFLFIHNLNAMLMIAPLIILIGIFSGALNGAATALIIQKIRENP
ncbi:MAG: Gx transporter family protein [Nitrospirae bacterium]|nr:Gx transporter family protein [Nitrospirota bacterium]